MENNKVHWLLDTGRKKHFQSGVDKATSDKDAVTCRRCLNRLALIDQLKISLATGANKR